MFTVTISKGGVYIETQDVPSTDAFDRAFIAHEAVFQMLGMNPELGTGKYLVRFERGGKEVGQLAVVVSYDLCVEEVR